MSPTSHPSSPLRIRSSFSPSAVVPAQPNDCKHTGSISSSPTVLCTVSAFVLPFLPPTPAACPIPASFRALASSSPPLCRQRPRTPQPALVCHRYPPHPMCPSSTTNSMVPQAPPVGSAYPGCLYPAALSPAFP